ncbi:MAG TPA: hypothetical protein VGQ57_08980 [Polyangiaceae bacterium]|jgi:hypothetical protein|nr:hypothetical protein [Polyangiaceae bacterium]
MDVKVFNKSELPIALGAVRALDPNITADQDALLATVAALHGVDLFPRALPFPGLAYLARTFRDQRSRRRLLELAVAAVMVDGQVVPGAVHGLDHLAHALDQSDRDLTALKTLASRKQLMARVDFTRRMAARMFGDGWAGEQERGTRKLLAGLLRTRDDAQVAARYHALGQLHPMSFGYALWQHFANNHFRFPGEGGGVPERLLFHDIGHVISGYGTDPEGELQQAAFYTGCTRDDGFIALYVGILQFEFGSRAAAEPDRPGATVDIDKVTSALVRGASTRLDLCEGWDFWPFVPQSLSDVRRSLGVPPMARSAAA